MNNPIYSNAIWIVAQTEDGHFFLYEIDKYDTSTWPSNVQIIDWFYTEQEADNKAEVLNE